MSEEKYIQEEGPSQDAEAAPHRSPYAADMPGQHNIMSRHYYQHEEIREETRHSPPDYPFDTTDIYNTPPVAQYRLHTEIDVVQLRRLDSAPPLGYIALQTSDLFEKATMLETNKTIRMRILME